MRMTGRPSVSEKKRTILATHQHSLDFFVPHGTNHVDITNSSGQALQDPFDFERILAALRCFYVTDPNQFHTVSHQKAIRSTNTAQILFYNLSREIIDVT